jgi:hypothetical protein
MDYNRGSPFWPDRDCLECIRLNLAQLEWIIMEEVSYGLTGIAINGASWFWPDCNDFELRNCFRRTGIVLKGGSWF